MCKIPLYHMAQSFISTSYLISVDLLIVTLETAMATIIPAHRPAPIYSNPFDLVESRGKKPLGVHAAARHQLKVCQLVRGF